MIQRARLLVPLFAVALVHCSSDDASLGGNDANIDGGGHGGSAGVGGRAGSIAAGSGGASTHVGGSGGSITAGSAGSGGHVAGAGGSLTAGAGGSITAGAGGSVTAGAAGASTAAIVFAPPFAGGVDSVDLATGDVDEDGVADVVTADNGSDTVSLLRGLRVGIFAPPEPTPAGDHPILVALAKIDGDAHLDLVEASAGDSTIRVFFGDGTGHWSAPVVVATKLAESLVTGDFDGDTHDDIVVVDEAAGALAMWRSHSDRTFGSELDFTAGTDVHDVQATDVDHDGHLDAVVTGTTAGTVIVLRNDGTGALVAQTPLTTGSGPVCVAARGGLFATGNIEITDATITPSFSILGPGSTIPINPYTISSGGDDGAISVAVPSPRDVMLINVASSPTAPVTDFVLTADGAILNAESPHPGFFLELAGPPDGRRSAQLDATGAFVTVAPSGVTGYVPVVGNTFDHATSLGQLSIAVLEDINGDGRPDFVNGLSVQLGDGRGGFGKPVTTTTDFTSFVYADFDGDHRVDAFGFSTTTGKGDVFHAQTNGTFVADPAFALGHVGTFTLADADDDGDIDLFIEASGVLYLHRNDGSGAFGAETTIAGVTGAFSIGRLDGDAHADLVTLRKVGTSAKPPITITVVHGNGDGTFGPGTVVTTGLHGCTGATVADVNGDAVNDLVIACLADPFGGTANVGALLGVGDGTFVAADAGAYAAEPGVPVLADMNADGRIDVAFFDPGALAPLDIAIGDGAGHFTLQSPAAFPFSPLQPETGAQPLVGDLDGDGRPDIIASGYDFFAGPGAGTFAEILFNRTH